MPVEVFKATLEDARNAVVIVRGAKPADVRSGEARALAVAESRKLGLNGPGIDPSSGMSYPARADGSEWAMSDTTPPDHHQAEYRCTGHK